MDKVKAHIRCMVRRDFEEVLAIESEAFGKFAWTEQDFIRTLRGRNVISMVAVHDDRVIGFMVYDSLKRRIDVLNFAVTRDFRRRGIGRQMADKLKGKLSEERRRELVLLVADFNLGGQLFWKAMGFVATGVDRGYWDTGTDAYRFRYRLGGMRGPAIPQNRIAGLLKP